MEGQRLVMSVRIAVSDPLPMFRRGMIATLGDTGYQPEAPEDLLAWARQSQRGIVLLTLHVPEDWRLLTDLRKASDDLAVIAVLSEAQTGLYVRAIVAGAVAVVSRDVEPESVKRVFDAAVEGKSLLPAEVVRALAAPRPGVEEEDAGAPSARELEWLRRLASGLTVSQLADRFGYSERAMFRLLRDLYARMRVRNRTEALMHAHKQGWI
jgi:DNA-binding NarL/FixJ family response regulator